MKKLICFPIWEIHPGGSKKSPDGMVCFGFGRAHNTITDSKGDNLEFIIGFIDKEIITADRSSVLSG